MSPAVARFLLDLVNAQQLNVGAPDFEQVVTVVLQARIELQEALVEDAPHSP